MPARFYVTPNDWSRNQLSEEESRHAQKVLRLKNGDHIELFNGEGLTALARIDESVRKRLNYEIESEELHSPIEPAIHLYQAIPKGKNMDLIIQKAVELGVTEIYPIITENTVAVSGNPTKKLEKWQRITLEACKQCKQSWLPIISEPQSLTKIDAFKGEQKYTAALTQDATPLNSYLGKAEAPESIAIAVGPEGDFTKKETDFLMESQFKPISLGNLILRVETATIYTVSAIRYAFLK